MEREKKSVWVVKIWDYDYDGRPYYYVGAVCATEELAEKVASKHGAWADVEEYKVVEEEEI